MHSCDIPSCTCRIFSDNEGVGPGKKGGQGERRERESSPRQSTFGFSTTRAAPQSTRVRSCASHHASDRSAQST
eukprot:3125457-Pleurochrysis_carterae.AAC.2